MAEDVFKAPIGGQLHVGEGGRATLQLSDKRNWMAHSFVVGATHHDVIPMPDSLDAMVMRYEQIVVELKNDVCFKAAEINQLLEQLRIVRKARSELHREHLELLAAIDYQKRRVQPLEPSTETLERVQVKLDAWDEGARPEPEEISQQLKLF